MNKDALKEIIATKMAMMKLIVEMNESAVILATFPSNKHPEKFSAAEKKYAAAGSKLIDLVMELP